MSRRPIFGQEASDEQASEQPSTRTSCPECQGDLRRDGDETVCAYCGLVVGEDRLDRGPEWRVVDADGRERTGAPLTPTRHDRGLSTEIGYGRDAKGNELSGRKRGQLVRLRREHSRGRWRSKAERNLAHGLSDVRRLVSALELPDPVRDKACRLFRTAQQEGLFRGRSIEGFAAASVYAACRCDGLPWTLDEIADVARCDQPGVENAYSSLNRDLGLPTPPPRAHDYVPRLASELDVGEAVRRRALELAGEADEAGLLTGCKPVGVAAACLSFAASEHSSSLSQTAVAEAAGVTATTLRTHRDTLRESLE